MKIFDMITMCLGNLFRRKMRTVLTIVGVVVGTCAIVIMISLGIGMSLSQEAMLAQMGDLTIIRVYNYGMSGDMDRAKLDDAMVSTFQQMEGVDVATPVYQPRYLNASIYSGRNDRYKYQMWNVMGLYEDAIPKMGYQLLEGEYPTAQPSSKKPIYITIGQYADYEFQDTKSKYNSWTWPEMDEEGNIIRQPFVDMFRDDLMFKTEKMDEDDPDTMVYSREIEVVGRMKEDWNKGYETAYGVLMTIEDAQKLEEEYIKINKIKRTRDETENGYDNVIVKTFTMNDVDAVEQQIQAFGFETNSMETMRKPMQEEARQQQMFLGMMGLISFVVAAIGITNTMIMSIYERTREIGVMKVVGCFVRNIRTMFLMEAGVIGFIGGIFGVGISYGVSFAMNYFNFSTGMGGGDMGGMMYYGMGMGEAAAETIPVSSIPPWLAVAAIIFATLMGLASGIIPANRAMKISALEAIKHE